MQNNLALLLLNPPGALFSALNVIAPAVLRSSGGGTLYSVSITTVGSAGNLTFNDCATTGAATAANQIGSWPIANLSVGQVITLKWPCANGIVVSSVPTGGSVSVAYT